MSLGMALSCGFRSPCSIGHEPGLSSWLLSSPTAAGLLLLSSWVCWLWARHCAKAMTVMAGLGMHWTSMILSVMEEK